MRALAEGTASDADAATLAAVTVQAVDQLLAELRPLVGEIAASGIYWRSLHLARSSFERHIMATAQTPEELLKPLRQDLAARSLADAGHASRALLTSIIDLLISLIGERLTHQMLDRAWPPPDTKVPKEDL